jgi:hypothetical protein
VEDEDLIGLTEATPAVLHSLKLLAFFMDKPVSWSMLAKSRFCLYGIKRE